jgi:methionyl-tRNA formyltransferase
MKLIFAGTPEFAAVALDALLAAGHAVALTLTQPDRPAGRGLKPRPSAVKALALARKLPLAQPASLKEPVIQEQLRAIGADAMVVAAYGLILPDAVLAIPARGCINIHASLLPRWRGAAPIQRAVLAGDRETGITIMQMDAGLDTGAILLQEKIALNDDDTAQTLHDKLAQLGARCVVRALKENPAPRAQDDTAATYADKITKAETVIDWARSAGDICRQIRAFDPVPGAVTTLDGATLKIWRAQPLAHEAVTPGTVMSARGSGIVVAAGGGAVNVIELQKAGSKRLAAAAFLAGAKLVPGARLGT